MNILDNPEIKRLYRVWYDMKRRCNDPRRRCYERYGGRGITFCEEWNKFSPFMEWSLANGYDGSAPYGACTLDRIDVNGDYTPENCRWVNNQVQCNNKRNNHMITFQGKTQSMMDWSREVNIPYTTLRSRIHNGWSPEKALLTRIAVEDDRCTIYVTYKGESKPLKTWCRELDLRYDRIVQRIKKRGWSVEDAFEK